MAATWEPRVRLIPNLEKAHPQVPSNISGKLQLDRTSGCRETVVTHTHTHTHQNVTEVLLAPRSSIMVNHVRNCHSYRLHPENNV